MEIDIQRVYDPIQSGEGACRVLVDRLWPRGLTRQQLPHDFWLKEIAPSTTLRKWFAHDRSRWEAFQQRYLDELAANPAVQTLLDIAARRKLILLYAARDSACNHALVLRSYLLECQR